MTLRLTAAALAVALAASSCGCRKQTGSSTSAAPPPREVWLSKEQTSSLGIATPAFEKVETLVKTGGKIAFDESRVAHVFSAATGRVVSISAELGRIVKKGDALAVVQSADVSAATSDLAKADADATAAGRDFARKKLLFDQHAASRADYDAAEDAVRRAHAERQRASQRVQLLKVGASDLVSSGFLVRSPIAGEVIARSVTPGMEVQGQYNGGGAAELFTVGDIDSVWLVADIFELDLPHVHAGEQVRVRSIAYPGKQFEGRVDWVASSLDPVTRVARTRCRFPNPGHELAPEMAMTVEIVTGATDALVVPSEAVMQLGDEHIVFVDRGAAPGGRERFEAVRVGAESLPNARTRIVSGLTVADRIVTQHAILLTGAL